MTRNLILRKISRAIEEATDGLPQDDLPDGHMVGTTLVSLQNIGTQLLTGAASLFLLQTFTG